jgi:hypothetical protein
MQDCHGKAGLRKKNTFYVGICQLNLRKKPIHDTLEHSLCSVETWTLRKVDQTYLGSLEM